MAGRKIFVGSLPNNISDPALRAEFSKYGQVEEVFVKPGCESGRQWAFVTFATAEQAQHAKECCDRVLQFHGNDRPCDVMMAKNQGMFGQSLVQAQPLGYDYQSAAPAMSHAAPVSGIPPRKIFVGSLPDGITDAPLRAEFQNYGQVEEIYIKQGCDPGRQWAFVTFASPEQASNAVEMTNGVLQFTGSFRPCEVTLARHQGLFGKGAINQEAEEYQQVHAYVDNAPRKIFVGSLPDSITDAQLRAEFSKYGQITDVFVKAECESGRCWAFMTFATADQATTAKISTDRVLMFPGSDRACEVTIARHQGMFGQDATEGRGSQASAVNGYGIVKEEFGARKVFVGSLPDSITEATLTTEFGRYGQITDVFLKQGCEAGRQWAFVTFATPEEAQYAKDATDRLLMLPGAERACEVMLAKNQGKFGQDPLHHQGDVSVGQHVALLPPAGAAGAVPQPPPPTTPPPACLTPWRMYRTASGLPYYHNHSSGVTQWECPPELQAPGQTNPYAPAAPQYAGAAPSARSSPY